MSNLGYVKKPDDAYERNVKGENFPSVPKPPGNPMHVNSKSLETDSCFRLKWSIGRKVLPFKNCRLEGFACMENALISAKGWCLQDEMGPNMFRGNCCAFPSLVATTMIVCSFVSFATWLAVTIHKSTVPSPTGVVTKTPVPTTWVPFSLGVRNSQTTVKARSLLSIILSPFLLPAGFGDIGRGERCVSDINKAGSLVAFVAKRDYVPVHVR